MYVYRFVAKAGSCGILCDGLFPVGWKYVVARTAPKSAIPDATRIFDSFWLLFVVYTLAGQAKHDAVVLPIVDCRKGKQEAHIMYHSGKLVPKQA